MVVMMLMEIIGQFGTRGGKTGENMDISDFRGQKTQVKNSPNRTKSQIRTFHGENDNLQ